MDKIEEKKTNKEDFDETRVIKDLGDIIKEKTRAKTIEEPNQESSKSKNNSVINTNKNSENNSIVSKEDNKKMNQSNTNKNDTNNTAIKKENDDKKQKIKPNEKENNNSGKNIIKEAEKYVNSLEQKEVKENKKEKNADVAEKTEKKKGKKALILLLTLMILILIIVVFSTIFSIININNDKIMSGVYVNNINISNYTKKDAKEVLEKNLNNNEINYVTVYRNGFTQVIHLEDINGKYNLDEIIDEAYKIGRNGNIVECNYSILNTMLFKKQITANFTFEKELLEKKIDEISLQMPDIALNSSYTIKDNKVIIKNSKAGYKIKENEFEKAMIQAFSTDKKNFEIPVEKVDKVKIDIEKIHNEIYKEAKDAYFTTNPYKIYKEENGQDFAISEKEVEQMLLKDSEEYEIPLKTIEPKTKVQDLGNEAFPNLLSTFTTTYGTADTNRNHNIYLAAKSITEKVVMPGETFSYNDLIGECSTRTGYRESTIYLNGKLSTGIGGGICQVSTTLYNAVVRANLEIVERRNHSLSVTYVPLGHDAMVSIGSSDFKFKNNREYPVKVVATTGTGSITCQIYGLKAEKEYEVKLETKVLVQTETVTKTQTYKVLYLDGKEVSRTLLSTDSYKKH